VGALVQDLLFADGWNADEPWTPLRRDVTEPVEDPGVRIEVIGAEQVHVRTAVQRATFDGSTFTDERWHAMAAGLPYADAQLGPGQPGRSSKRRSSLSNPATSASTFLRARSARGTRPPRGTGLPTPTLPIVTTSRSPVGAVPDKLPRPDAAEGRWPRRPGRYELTPDREAL